MAINKTIPKSMFVFVLMVWTFSRETSSQTLDINGTLPCAPHGDGNVYRTNISDTLQTGDVAFTMSNTTRFTLSEPTCLDFFKRGDGLDVKLKNPLTRYCGVSKEISCTINCEPAVILRMAIVRNSRYNVSFTQQEYNISVVEMNTAGVSINGNAKPTVTRNCLAGGNSDEELKIYKLLTPDVPFTIGETTSGPTSITVTKQLDHEKQNNYTLLIVGSFDALNGSATATINIHVQDIDDNSPEFSIKQGQYYRCNVTEEDATVSNQPLPVSPAITAKDPDFGINETILYHLEDVFPDPSRQNITFTMNNATAEISVTGTFDFEEVKEYRLTIKAYQQDKPETRTAVAALIISVIDADDNKPYFNPDHISVSVKEHTALNTTVTYVSAIDKDSGVFGQISYHLDTQGTPFGVFNFTDTVGVLVVGDSVSLDREKQSSFMLQITPNTHDGQPGTNTLSVNVTLLDINDNNPNFTEQAYTFTVPTSAVNDVIATVEANDADSGGNGQVTYKILMTSVSTGSCTASRLPFTLNETTGEFVMQEGMVCPEYRFVVEACDNPDPASHESHRCDIASVTITDTATNGTRNLSKNFSILEELPNGTYIGPLVCSGSGLNFTSENSNFRMENNDLLTNAVLDRESQTDYNFNVLVSSSSLKVACNINITVNLKDINDHAPVFSQDHYTFHLSGAVSEDTNVGQVQASDTDTGRNSEVTFAFGNTVASTYEINDTTGHINVAKPDMTSSDIEQLVVIARDGGVPQLQSTVVVYILVNSSVMGTVPISTPFSVDEIKKTNIKFEGLISRILGFEVVIKSIEPAGSNAGNMTHIRSKIYIGSKDETVSQRLFMSDVFSHYEEIRALFYTNEEQNQSGDDAKTIGEAEIGLIVMAAVILIGAIVGIVVINRQFNSHKRYKQLYENMTKESSLYESQELKVNMPEETSDYNGSVNTQELAQADTNGTGIGVASVNPAFVSDEDTAVKVTDVTIEAQPEMEDATVVKDELQSLDQRLDKEEEEREGDVSLTAAGEPDNEDTSDQQAANSNGAVVYANVAMSAGETGPDLINLDGENDDMKISDDKEPITEHAEVEAEDEPNPDYDIKAVRFHTEVLDAGENKLEPLKVKEEGNTDDPEAQNDKGETDGNKDMNENNDDDHAYEHTSIPKLSATVPTDGSSSPKLINESDTNGDGCNESFEPTEASVDKPAEEMFYYGDEESTHF